MNKLLIFSNILILNFVGLCQSEVIPVAVQSTRQFDYENVNLDSNPGEQYNPHVFEIEPSSSPLRLVFNSESSPLSLELEKQVAKVFEETPLKPSPDAKQDRSGAVGTDDSDKDVPVVNVGSKADTTAGSYNDDQYIVVDQYQRYVPVTVRGNGNEDRMGSNDRVFVIKPAKSAKTEAKQKAKKVKVPVIKAEKMTTAKPVLAKQVVATKPAEQRTTPAETVTESTDNEKETPKFGTRIARHANKKETGKKERTSKNKKQN